MCYPQKCCALPTEMLLQGGWGDLMWCSHSLGHLGQSWSSWSSFRFLVLASSSIQPVSPDPLELFEPHISDMYFWMEIHGVRCIRSFWFFIFFSFFFDMITGLQWINWLVFGQSCLDLPLVLASPSIQPVSLDPFEIFESHISNMNFSMEINGVRSFCFFLWHHLPVVHDQEVTMDPLASFWMFGQSW